MNCFRSRKKQKKHITVIVNCNSEEFKGILDVIKKAVRAYNRSSDSKMSFYIIKEDMEVDTVCSGNISKIYKNKG